MNKQWNSFRFALVIVYISDAGINFIDAHTPNADFVRVGIDRYIKIMNCIEINVNQILCIRRIGNPVCPLRTGGKEKKIAGRNSPFSLGCFQNAISTENKEGLFVFVMIVVRIGRLMGWDFIYTDHSIPGGTVGDYLFTEIFKLLLFMPMRGRQMINGKMFDF